MIINGDKSPKKTLYYIGWLILKLVKEQEIRSIERIVEEIIASYDNVISINTIYYALDWLFILNIIEIEENEVVLCK